MSSFEAFKGDVVFDVVGIDGAKLGIEELRATSHTATAGMSNDLLKLAQLQENYDRAVARSGGRVTGSLARAELALRDFRGENEKVAVSANNAGGAFAREGRDIERLGRGALVGSGLVRGLGRAAAFSSTAFLGGAGLVYAIRSTTEEARKHIVLEGQLRSAVEASGNSYSGYKGQIDGAIDSAVKLGFTEADAIAAFTNLVVAAGDVDQAQRLMGLSADIARKKNKDLADSSAVVAKAAGGTTGALKRLIPGLGEAKDVSAVLAAAQLKVAGSADTYAKSVAGAHDRSAAAIEREKEQIGTGLLPIQKKLDNEISAYLGNAANQKRIQDDVNRAIKDGTQIVHGLVAAEKLVSPPIHAIIGALGGLEHAVEVALVLKLALKAKAGAASLGLIEAASIRARTQIVTDAAIEEKALAGVAATAAATAETIAAAGAIGGAGAAGGLSKLLAGRAAAGGAAVTSALGKGGRLLTKGGELYLVYKGVEFALNAQPGSDGGANRYGGSLSHGYGNLFSDALHGHLGRIVTDLYKGAANEGFGANYGSSNTIKNPLTFLDVLPAIQGGYLTLAALQGLRPRFTSQADYRGAAALIRDQQGPARVKVAGGASGSFTKPGFLSPQQQRDQAVTLHPDDPSALTAEVTYYNNAIAFLNKRQKAGAIGGKAYIDQLKALTAQRDGYQSTIDQINQAARSKATAARLKEQRAVDDARHQALRDVLSNAGPIQGAFAVSGDFQRALIGRQKIPARAGGSYQYQSFSIPLRLQVDAARAATTATLTDDQKAAKAIRDFAKAAIKSRHLQGQALIDAFNAITSANATIGQTPNSTDAARANERQFLSSFADIQNKFGGNTIALGGPTNTHLYELVHETRRTNAHLAEIKKTTRFPGTHGAQTAVEAAFG